MINHTIVKLSSRLHICLLFYKTIYAEKERVKEKEKCGEFQIEKFIFNRLK